MLDLITQEFLVDSAIAPEVFQAAVKVCSEVEVDDVTHEVTATPIHDALGWAFTRFTHQARNLHAALFLQETGEVWQGKIYGLDKGKQVKDILTPREQSDYQAHLEEVKPERSGRYLAPKGIGNRAYLPPVPQKWREKIAKRYGLTAPPESESFWAWVFSHPQIALTITEGGKKTLALLSQGVVAIGLYGCLCGESPDLIPYLKRKNYIAFDRDTKKKAKKAVINGIYKLSYAVIKAGGEPRIVQWLASQGKGVDDLAAGGINLKLLCTDSQSLSFETWKRPKYDLAKYDAKKVNQKYINIVMPEKCQFIAIKSPKGTGKTQWLSTHVVDPTINKGTPVIALGHRVKLMVEIARRLNIDYRTDNSALKHLLGYAMCIHSCHPKAKPSFDATYWGERGGIVIIDEVEQVIKALLFESTLRDSRASIFLSIQTLLRETIVNGGKLVIADADLSSRSIDLLLGMIGIPTLKPYVIENIYQGREPRDLITFNNPANLMTEVIAQYQTLGDDEKIFIATGSQKESSNWGTIVAAQRLIEAGALPTEILRVDSQTVSDPNHPAYRATDNLAEAIKPYKIILASPTLETGVSLDSLAFVAVFGFFSGVQSIDSCSQALERVRVGVPRYVWAPVRHNLNLFGGGEDSPSALITREQTLASALATQLAGIEYTLLDGENPCLLSAYAAYAAEQNGNAKRYRAALLEKMEGEGYRILSAPEGDGSAEAQRVQEIKARCHEQFCQAVASAPAPDDVSYQRLKEKAEKTEAERHQEERGRIARTYLTEDVTPPLVDKDSQGWVAQLTLTYYLTTGREFLTQRDTAKINRLTKETEGKAMTTDLNRSTLSVQVKALELLGFKKWLDVLAAGGELSGADLDEWFEWIKPQSKQVKQALNFGISSKDTAMGVLARGLAKLGLKLTSSRRRVNGRLTRFYSLSPCDDGREEVLARWYERDCASSRDCSTPPDIDIYKGGVEHLTA
jgi:hypothetical protein